MVCINTKNIDDNYPIKNKVVGVAATVIFFLLKDT